MHSIALVMTVLVLAVTLLSCITDIRSMRIPNWHALAIIGCFIPAWLAAPQVFNVLWQHVAALSLMFVITYAMFCLGMMGGGDAKLATALGLWLGLTGLMPFLFYMSIMGGILGLMALGLRRKKIFKNPLLGSWVDQAQSGRSAVPYGIAINFGTWAAFFHTGFVDNQLNEVFKIIH